jgi:uncharacterized protein (TIGR00290 family)
MGLKKRVTVSWSGGKDSALSLFRIISSGEYEVINLHTVIDEETNRVGLHGVREALIEQQAENIGIPLVKIYLRGQSAESYAKLMKSFYMQCARQGIEGVVFGDIFLSDLRQYRESLLKGSKLVPYFPLWGIDTEILWQDFIHVGFKTMICSADASMFKEEDLGKMLPLSFKDTLKPGVDVCGENGEFHTLVCDGPIFTKPLIVEPGVIVKRSYTHQRKDEYGKIEQVETSFLFQDLLPRMA